MNISDEKLYWLCKRYGRAARLWRQKFIGLLPEVYRRRLYERKGFESIFEFAAKLAGLSQEQVRLALNLEKRFEDKPALKSLLLNGEVSLNKLARVVSIASVDNEKELAEKVRLLSQKTLETLTRDERIFEKQNGLSRPLFDAKSLRAQTLNFELSAELVQQLNELNVQGHDMNTLLLNLLRKRKDHLAKKKQEFSEASQSTNSRYIPAAVKKILMEEFGIKCSIRTCSHPAKEVHHTQRFGLARTHDPKYLAPLCHEHHTIAHSIDQKIQAYHGS
ncbi:MAG: hypothetical protein WC924_02815 [Candidatus Gracilibacteria bacterium]